VDAGFPKENATKDELPDRAAPRAAFTLFTHA
jgi:hypothetical protein